MSGFSINGALKQIRKSNYCDMPFLIEAIMNSIEANAKEICIKFEQCENNLNVTIADDGDGFNDENYNRFVNLFDNSKQKKNKGCGRLQYLHYFDRCEFYSKYLDKSNSKLQRKFTFLRNSDNGITLDTSITLLEENTIEIGTELKLIHLQLKKDKKDKIITKLTDNIELVKYDILNICFYKFALLNDNMPNIKLQYNNNEAIISKDDLSHPKIEDTIEVYQSKLQLSDSKLEVENTNNKQSFNIIQYSVPNKIFNDNAIYLCSKDIPVLNITKQIIDPSFIFSNDKKHIYFVSSDYFDDDNIVNPSRDDFEIPKKDKDFKDKGVNLFPEEYIVLERLIQSLKSKLETAISEIKEARRLKDEEIKYIGNNLGCNEDEITEVKKETSLLSTEEEIRKKLGTKKGIKNINSQQDINTEFINFKTYQEFNTQERLKIANSIVSKIEEQNKNDLSQYVIRRQIEVELLNEFIKNNVIESFIHNLIFQKGTDNEVNSEHNLWMINEDFANYDYIMSETPLKDIKYKNELIFESDIENESELLKCGITNKNANDKRPDIAIFHELGAILIIDFKKPDKECFSYTKQIRDYAKLMFSKMINNKLNAKFYAYIIGEKLGVKDDDYTETPDREGYFRNNTPIEDINNSNNKNSVYIEVQKYSRLQKLAKLRNSNFAKKLCNIENIEAIVNNIISNINKETKKP